MITYTYASLAVLTLACLGLIILGLKAVIRRIGIDAEHHEKTLKLIGGVMVLWLALTFFLGNTGILLAWDAIPPRLPFIPLIAFLSIILMNRSKIFPQLLAKTPLHWLIAFQTFRIAVELIFWGAYQAGYAPAVVTFEGRNWDVLVGLSAPLVALGVAKFNWGPNIAIAWNAIGIAILGNTIFTVITSTPGPLHNDWPGEPFQLIATWPFIWIPAFLAPLAIFLHVASIRQNLMLTRKNLSDLKAVR